jgi:phage replication O-like protein O
MDVPTLQPENGFLQIKNEIAEALARTNLSAYQSRILWALWRKTWGWNKAEDWISNSQFVEMTGISKGHVSRTVKELILRNIVTQSGNKMAFNEDFTQWRELPIGVRAYQTVTNSGNSVTPSGNAVTNSGKKVTPSGGHKRHYTKDTLTKDTIQKTDIRARFERFYSIYPKKKSKHDAEKAFLKINPDDQLLTIMMSAIERDKASEEWIKQNGQFIPYPATWLNNRRWEDEGTEQDPAAHLLTETGRRTKASLQGWSPTRLPTQEEELAEFNEQWDREHGNEKRATI